MQIETRHVDDVAVITVVGKVTLGEGDLALRDVINSLVTDRGAKVVLDLTRVPYIDSAGVGELVRSFTTVSRHGGRLVLCSPPRVVYVVGGATPADKLITAFQVGHSIEDCLAFFLPSNMHVSCPVCAQSLSLMRGRLWPRIGCPGCGAQICIQGQTEPFYAELLSGAPVVRSALSDLWLPTYDDENIHVHFEQHVTITANGRLDLFASEVVERAWHLLSPPRAAVFAMSYHRTEFTAAGVARVLALCHQWTDTSRAVFWAYTQRSQEFEALVPNDERVHQTRASADAALGPIESRPIEVAVRLGNHRIEPSDQAASR